MPRIAAGKPLTLFPIRVDEDVKTALLGFKAKGTINQGLRVALLIDVDKYTPAIEKRIAAQVKPRVSRILREKGDKTR